MSTTNNDAPAETNVPRLCVTCSTPYVKGQTFENHNEQGDWMCKDCWMNEALASCLKMTALVGGMEKRQEEKAEADKAEADKLVDDVYA
jgi:hypothetical protein